MYHKLNPMTVAGVEGYRNEYLTCLTALMYDPQANDALELHADFTMHSKYNCTSMRT